MIVRHWFAFAVCLSFGLIASIAAAEDAPATPAATADDIAAWVKQLDHDGFNIRESAQQKLAGAGAAAVDALGEAALGKSQEAATRAVEVLKKHAHGEDASLKGSARGVLDKIAQGDNPIAARRAEAALQSPAKPDTTPADQNTPPTPFGPRGIRIGGGAGAIQIQVHTVIGGGKGKSISVKNVDGNKEINVEEEGRKIKIEESAAGKIKMSVTEKKDGKAETKSYEAESAEDLKKVQPEAYKIYDQYKQGGIGGRIEFKAVPLPARIGGVPALPVPAVEPIPAERPNG